MPRFENPIEYAFAGEAAASLGHAGRKLRKTLDELHRYDAQVAELRRKPSAAEREELVMIAGEAYWGYVVQRELLGLLDPDYIAAEYGVPAEVRRVMGPRGLATNKKE